MALILLILLILSAILFLLDCVYISNGTFDNDLG